MSNLHEDYLLRLLRPFVAAMAQILFFKKERDAGRALAEINTASEKLLGLNASLLTLLSERYLTDLLEKDTDYGALRCMVLAALLKQEGDIYALLGDEDGAVLRWLKALRVYLDLLPTRDIPDAESHLMTVEDIAGRLRGFEVDPALRRVLWAYLERKTRYAQAENILFDMLDQQPDDSALIRDGITFYERLASLHPARLIAGGLPLIEVQSGLAELHAMRSAL